MGRKRKEDCTNSDVETRQSDDVMLALTTLIKDVSINLQRNTAVIQNMHQSINELSFAVGAVGEAGHTRSSGADVRNTRSGVADADTTITIRSDEGERSSVATVTEESKNKKYISAWKDLGGNSICFSPGGSMHPVAFIRKLQNVFDDAGVPENKRVRYAVNNLRGSAADWGQIKETVMTEFGKFKNMFLSRYWGPEEERELFNKIRFGRYERGSRADYFLKIVREADFLSKPLPEKELVDLVIPHFPWDIYRGILNSGYSTAEEVEKHLRKIDKAYENEPQTDRPQNWRDQNRQGRRVTVSNNNNNLTNDNQMEIRAGRRDAPVSTSTGESSNAATNTRGARENVSNISFTDVPEVLLSDDQNGSDDENDQRISPEINLAVQNLDVVGLIDSGSPITCIAERVYHKLLQGNKDLITLPTNGVTIKGAFGARTERVKMQVLLNIKIEDADFEVPGVVVPTLNRDLILGCDFMNDHGVKIDINARYISYVYNGIQRIKHFIKKSKGSSVSIGEVDVDEEVPLIKSNNLKYYSEQQMWEIAQKAERFSADEKVKLYQLLYKYKDIFSDQPGLTHLYFHEIEMRTNEPFFVKSYPIPFKYRDAVRLQIQEMVDWGVIEPARTEYVSPLVVVSKKDKSVRVCLDARTLNERMCKDHVQPQNPEELLFRFSSGQIMSSLDLTASYWQVPIKPEDRKYTGFLYEGTTYVFKVLPFGLSTSVASFIRGLNKILGAEVEDFVLPYVDDLLVYSSGIEEHLHHLQTLFEKFRIAGCTLKLRKCVFARQEVSFLGHVITANGISVDPKRVESIRNFPRPRNIKHLRSFLGLCNFDRRFCQNYGELTKPLLNLLKKNVQWRWLDEHERAFNNVKDTYLRVTFLRHADPNLGYYIQADSSGYGIGACLFQKFPEGIGIIAFYSRTLRPNELGYFTTEKELLAILAAIKHWRIYVVGADLTVVTDHKALSFLMKCRLLNARLTRWVLFLQEYHFKIVYCKGSDNILADALSRYPLKNCNEEGDEPFGNNKCIEIDEMWLSQEFKQLKVNLTKIEKEQKSDEKFGRIVRELTNDSECLRAKSYKLHKGILFKLDAGENGGYRICVPKSSVVDLVKYEHETKGHFGGGKVFAALKKWCYFPKMRKTIRHIVGGCQLCQKAKISLRCHGKMQSILPNRPGELVCLDLVGPLPRSRLGATQLLVLVDAFSKFVTLYPLRRATTVVILRRLEQYFVEVGKPIAILSDNGTQFANDRWKNAMEEKGIRVRYTSRYYPQGNPTERVNRELIRLLRMLCHDRHTKWAVVLKDIAGYINNAIHESTGYTPFQIHFSKTERNPLLKGIEFPTGETSGVAIVELAHERLRSKAQRRKARHDQNHVSDIQFQPGDKVLVRSHRLSSADNQQIKKFFLLFEGPCTVEARVHENAYLITDDVTGKSRGIQNIYNLKPYKPNCTEACCSH